MRITSTVVTPPFSPATSITTDYATRVEDSARSARAVTATDRALDARIDRANASVESGGRGVVPSRLVTTAGPGSPASYGRSQLLVSLQVDGLLRHATGPAGPASIERLGVGVADLRAMQGRGTAATAWYDAIVGRDLDASVPLDRAAIADIRRRAAAGDLETIVAVHGKAFQAATGIPASELGFLALTTRLTDPSVSAEYRRLRAHHGVTGSLDRLVARHPELAALRTRMADDRSLDFFLRRPRRNGEHRAAWYTRAARVDGKQYDRLVAALVAGGDRITTAERNRRNVEVARRYLSSLQGDEHLTADQRSLLVGQLARVQHGNPAFFRDRFGTAEDPRLGTVAELQRVLDGMMQAPAHTVEGDQGRSVRAFTDRFLRPAPAPAGARVVLP